ncbi:hypothetical protein [Capillimicrobium parvum]|uniref:Uncharacterized protein n=1 Tax=Capillimicrobium parvum TaxID=2884022 RepID=A0A9E6Y2F4_9ACTN|nr:hypothetical protein [Capillimicrobium parvum]UGS38810.1 hypothetical protein DSM104329_05240 [Capillimicrobium parvum]
MAETLRGNWEATTLLFCGASHMGKSWAAKNVLVPQYGAVYRQVDRMYTVAAMDAGMLPGGPTDKPAAKEARRRARNRSWPSPEAGQLFFGSFERQVRQALQEGLELHAPVVIEGGTLRWEEEAEIAARCAREVNGPDARIVRATFQMSYERWLQNRVNRMLLSRVETVPLRALSVETYKREAKDARPKPSDSLAIEDVKLRTPAALQRLMADLDRSAAAVQTNP